MDIHNGSPSCTVECVAVRLHDRRALMPEACRDQIPYLWLTRPQHPVAKATCHEEAVRADLRRAMKLVDLAVPARLPTREQELRCSGLGRLLERLENDSHLEAQNEARFHLPEELADKEAQAMADLASQKRHSINLTDPEARLMKGQGSWPATTPRLWSHYRAGGGSDRHVGHRRTDSWPISL